MYKCLCGSEYTQIPDEEADSLPPSYRARMFHCNGCGETAWRDPVDFDMDDWPIPDDAADDID